MLLFHSAQSSQLPAAPSWLRRMVLPSRATSGGGSWPKNAAPQKPAVTLPALTQGTEILPGYVLIEMLGCGGYGVVWKAMSPGNILKAVKFVRSNSHSIHSDDYRVELQALDRIKNVHHPFVMSVERFDLIGDYLVIITELMEGNLWDRFCACRAQGMTGIPRDELIGYMIEAAEALDYLAESCGLQHLDIKPQNLFMVCNHLKVGDFDLVQELANPSATLTNRLTPLYAAPELFNGQISRYSDQYGLAIIFAELLTGRRPFNGVNARQLLIQHCSQPPQLDALSPSDQAAVGRALAKNPAERFASCLEFVAALAAQEQRSVILARRRKPAAPRLTPVEPTQSVGAEDSALTTLIDGLQAPDVDTCRKSVLSLRQMGPAARPSLPTYGRLLQHPDPNIRWQILHVVEQAGAEAEKLLPALLTALEDERDIIRVKAAEVLVRLDPRQLPTVLRVLVDVLNQNRSDCLLALQVLGRMGSAARSAVPAIVNALRGKLRGVAHRQAVQTLEKLGAAPAVIAALSQPGSDIAIGTAFGEEQGLVSPVDLARLPDNLILTLAKVAVSREGLTPYHLTRLQRLSRCLAEKAMTRPEFNGQLDSEFVSMLERYVPLQDIGKAFLPDNILLKPARLEEEERRVMQTHTIVGAMTLRDTAGPQLPNDGLRVALDIVRHHHESYDGSGYPDHLAGNEIPLAARIVAVADVYNALRSRRVFRRALTPVEALRVMTEESAHRFDPVLLEVFQQCVPQLERIFRELSE